MPDIIFAFDKNTSRSKDADGRMRVKDCILSTAEVNPYRGREIPKNDELGLEANKVYDLWRSPEELGKAVASFEGVPLMIKHIPQTAEQPRKEYMGGSVHSVKFDGKHLRGDLLVFDGMAIELIESDELSDLSCGYRYKPVMRSGDAGGQHYDGVMTDIQGNHVALVDDGRASGAHVADSALRSAPEQTPNGDSKMPFPNENEKPEGGDAGGEEQPNAGGAPNAGAPEAAAPAPGAAPAAAAPADGGMAAIGQALKHIAACLTDIQARLPQAGAAAPAAPGAMDSENGENDEMEQKPEGAADMELEAAVKGDSEGGAPEMNAGGGDNPSLPAPKQDGTGARGENTPYGAMDARTVKTVQSAVDQALKRERARVSALNEACRDVRGVLGDVYGMDHAGDVYRAALEVKGVTGVAKGAEKAAWQGYISGAAGARGARNKTEMAMDSNAVEKNQSGVLAHLAKISVKG